MEKLTEQINIIDVTSENVSEAGIYCIKDKKAAGYKAKLDWFCSKLNHGLKIKIALDNTGKQIGFIEYLPSEQAWRPVKAANFYFIQCIALFVKDAKQKGVASYLIRQCELDAKQNGKSGICAMSSDGVWMADKTVYEKNGFIIADRLDRFELMVKSFEEKTAKPSFYDWTKEQKKYQGWHLLYADQCPWHEKSAQDLQQSAIEHGIMLQVKKSITPKEAQKAPSGFGTFSLLRDGKLLADHYISRTRFENILKQENI
ncbi:MAG: YoaP domain-containing protein [Bacteroidota bacterium]